MSGTAEQTRAEGVATDVAAHARLLARAGLVEAFGHVSARVPGGGLAITSTAPLATAATATVLVCTAAGEPSVAAEDLPLETALHAAVYAARDDVGAIARIHSPAAVAAGAIGAVPPVVHGLGGLSGTVACSEDPQLVTDGAAGERAAAALAAADCLLISGNGAVVTAPSLAEAAVRAWFLEERARVWLAADRPPGLSPAELDERSRHYPAETIRASAWLRSRFGEGDR